MLGLGSTVKVKPKVTVHTPFEPDNVAEPGPANGGIELKAEFGPPGFELFMSGIVNRVYVLAPPAVSVMVFGEPLKAWVQSVGELSCPLSGGGGTTFTVE